MIKVKSPRGSIHNVTDKAFKTIYQGQGFTAIEEDATIADVQEKDYSTYEDKQLEEVTNDDLKAFLDTKEVEYKSNATKKDLIKLVKGK